MPISNCSKCGAVFARTDKAICPDCLRKEEAEFQKAVEWIRANPGKTISALSESTGIKSADILRWLREQRLAFTGGGKFLVCNKCGKVIEAGNFCEDCKVTLSREITDHGRDNEAGKRKEKNVSGGMHYNRHRQKK